MGNGAWTRRGTTNPALAVGLALAAMVFSAGSAGAQVFVEPGWLMERLEDPDLVVLQVGPEELYRERHVPGAVHVTTARLARPMGDGPHDRHLVLELPDPPELRRTLEGLGVSDGSRVVVVPAAAWITPAARVAFTLHQAGLGDRTHLLDGGLEAWIEAGGAVTDRRADPGPGRLTGAFTDRIVTSDWVLEHGAGPGVSLLDGRAAAFFDGVRDDQGTVGHLPGARSVPWPELVDTKDDRWRMKRPEALRALLEAAGVGPGDRVVAYCHIGQFGSLLYLAARSLGYDARLYDGSVNEWRLLGLPLEAGPRDAGAGRSR